MNERSCTQNSANSLKCFGTKISTLSLIQCSSRNKYFQELKCINAFSEPHYNLLTKNKYYLLYYSISINIKTEEGYQLCHKLLDFMKDLNKELNFDFKADKDEEAKESILDRRFAIHFDNINCTFSANDVELYNTLMGELAKDGYSTIHVSTDVLQPKNISILKHQYKFKAVTYLDSVNSDIIKYPSLKATKSLNLKQENELFASKLNMVNFGFNKFELSLSLAAKMAEDKIKLKTEEFCKHITISILKDENDATPNTKSLSKKLKESVRYLLSIFSNIRTVEVVGENYMTPNVK